MWGITFLLACLSIKPLSVLRTSCLFYARTGNCSAGCHSSCGRQELSTPSLARFVASPSFPLLLRKIEVASTHSCFVFHASACCLPFPPVFFRTLPFSLVPVRFLPFPSFFFRSRPFPSVHRRLLENTKNSKKIGSPSRKCDMSRRS